jgi:hypothetical protein
MTSFQIIATCALAAAECLTLALAIRHRISPRLAFAWSILWIAAGVAIIVPELTVIVAHALGIARGADLVFYLAILGMFAAFFATFVRIRRLDTEITKIVRELAILRAERSHDQDDAS